MPELSQTKNPINPSILQKLRYYKSVLQANIRCSEQFDIGLLNYSTYYTYNTIGKEFVIDFSGPQGMVFLDKVSRVRNGESIAIAIRYNINGHNLPILVAYLGVDDISNAKLIFEDKALRLHGPTLEALGWELVEIEDLRQEMEDLNLGEQIQLINKTLASRIDNIAIIPQQFCCGIVNITSFDKIILESLNHIIVRADRIKSQDTIYKYLVKKLPDFNHTQTPIIPIQTLLNEDQLYAVEHFFDSKIQTLNGPPGTGKSQTIAEFVLQAIYRNNKVLVTSYNNKPVDVVFDKVRQIMGLDMPLPLLTNDIQGVFKDYVRYVRSLKAITTLKALQTKLEILEANTDDHQLDIIITRLNIQLISIYDRDLEVLEDATTNTTRIYQGRKILNDIITDSPIVFSNILKGINNLPLTEKNFFDYIIVDEASQCNSIAIVPLLPMTRNLLVVGDPKQLQHIASMTNDSHKKIIKEYSDKDMDNDFTYLSQSLFDYVDSIRLASVNPELFLSYHYRCHDDIIEFSNINYYNSRLKLKSNIINGGMNWVNTQGHTFSNNTNDVEVAAVITRTLHYLQSYPPKAIGIISQYRNQVSRIKKALKDAGIRDISVGTIHTFQGDEKEVILYSPVYSENARPDSLKFINIDQINIINVAVSRSKQIFEVIGDQNYIDSTSPQGSILYNLSQYITSKKL
jgi:hypothetical protein